MDINEVTDRQINRHPWELSRTKCVITDVLPYMKECEFSKDYINIGSGDMYFDRGLMKQLVGYTLHAVDIGYEETDPNRFIFDKEHIHTYAGIEDLPESLKTDCAFMMDSLEYMEDEVAYIEQLASHVRTGGYLFFTFPAFKSLFSEHDIIVKLLRRYDKKDFLKIANDAKGVTLVNMHYFYTPLVIIRFLQKSLHLKIDPDHKVTTGWRYSEKHVLTRLVKGILDIDYAINKALGKIRLDIPGLSIYAVLRKD